MSTGAIFIDLSKTFNLVNHYILINKLHAIGLSKQALFWFNSYLHFQHQGVLFQGSLSCFAIMEKGVFQGSLLGPLLFSIFINDLYTYMLMTQWFILLILIYLRYRTIFNLILILFNNGSNVMIFMNEKKSYCMLFPTRSASMNQTNLVVNFLEGTPLGRVDEYKYLGLWIDSELSFKTHINYIVRKLNCNLRMWYRSCNCFTQQIKLRTVQLLLPLHTPLFSVWFIEYFIT